MADTTFELRGHTLFHLVAYGQYSFIFSAVLEGRIQYYQFKERKTEEEIREAEAAMMQPGAAAAVPIIILARGTGGPKFMKVEGPTRLGQLITKGENKIRSLLHARTRDNNVFVKVELWDRWGAFVLPWTISFNPMRHVLPSISISQFWDPWHGLTMHELWTATHRRTLRVLTKLAFLESTKQHFLETTLGELVSFAIQGQSRQSVV